MSGKMKELSFEDFVSMYTAEFAPQGIHEEFLIEQMAHAQWKLQRFAGIETAAVEGVLTGAHKATFRKLAAAAKKTYEKSRRQLEAARKKRPLAASQFGIPVLPIN